MLASPLCDGPGFVREKYEFLGQKVGFLFCPKGLGEPFSPKDGVGSFGFGLESESPPPPYLGFQGLHLSPPFFWLGWLEWILGRGFFRVGVKSKRDTVDFHGT